MTNEGDNPVGVILRAFREIDYGEALKGELGRPVTKYDLTETMLVLANAQMAILNIASAMIRKDDEEVAKNGNLFTAQMSNVIAAALAAGGKEFSDKVHSEWENGHE